MTDPDRSFWDAPVPGSAVVLGPGAALLHEMGTLSIGPQATLWPILVIVIVAAAGLAIGLRAAARPPRLAGVLAALPNAAVVAFYGFLVLFFGLGGSR